jgi:hypothetical protein
MGILFEDNWESGCNLNNWTVIDNGATNQWETGTALGTCCAYISNDGGTSAAYTNTAASTTWMYVDVDLPTNITELTIFFAFRCVGQNGTGVSDFDFGFVGIGKTTFTPSGTDSFDVPNSNRQRVGAISNDGKFNSAYNGGGWIGENIVLTTSNEFINPGETVRVFFGWKNDSSVGTNPPFAIDNVSISSVNSSGSATNLISKSLGNILVQSGSGVPTHNATKGSLYTDIDTGLLYTNQGGWSFVSLIAYGGILLSGNTTGVVMNNTAWLEFEGDWYETGVCNGVIQNATSGNTLEVCVGRGGRYQIDVSAYLEYSSGTGNAYLGVSINGEVPQY